jgi:hypothetical protein
MLTPADLTIRFRRVRNQQFVWITGANGLIENYFVQTAAIINSRKMGCLYSFTERQGELV